MQIQYHCHLKKTRASVEKRAQVLQVSRRSLNKYGSRLNPADDRS